MHRSIVSLMMSLVGTELSEDDNRPGDTHQSFADSFVNEAAQGLVIRVIKLVDALLRLGKI